MYKWKDMDMNIYMPYTYIYAPRCIWGWKIFLQVKDMDLCLDLKLYWFYLVPKKGETSVFLLVIWGQELLKQLRPTL